MNIEIKFRFGNKVRVRDRYNDDWEEGLYLESQHGAFQYLVYVNSELSIYWKQCELVEAVPDVLRPKFKVGDIVTVEGLKGTMTIAKSRVSYVFEGSGVGISEEYLTLAPKEIKVGSEVCGGYNKTCKGKVLALFIEPTDNKECAVVKWGWELIGQTEYLKDLEVI